jgi:ribosomal-protein-alanine N-acetyltransferase
MTFRLIPIGRDGRPQVPLIDLPEDIRAMLDATADMHARIGFEPPWIGYLALDGDEVVGGGAFVGPPQDGRVEIAYFTRPEHEGRGHAAKTAAALVAIAREAQPGLAISAKTAPEPGPSPAILTRLGFQRDGVAIDHEIGEAWAWLLR